MKRPLGIAALAAVAVVAACGTPSGGEQADELYYGSAAELDAAASAVIRGLVTSVADPTPHDASAIATVTLIASAKGDLTSPVEIDFIPASDGTPMSSPIEEGFEYVFFVATVDSYVGLVNSTQGWYRVADDQAIPGPNNEVQLDPTTASLLGLS